MLSDDEIQLMEAILGSGSLSQAAAKLGKAPSTVSYSLRQIETRFDALLFDRRRYRLQLWNVPLPVAASSCALNERCTVPARVA